MYAFIPTENKLAGEHAIVGNTDSLISSNNLATEITIGDNQILTLDEYLQTGVDEFLKLVAERNTFGTFEVEQVQFLDVLLKSDQVFLHYREN